MAKKEISTKNQVKTNSEKTCSNASNNACCKDIPYIIFSISGGIGKNIMATAVITSIKAAYPNHKLIVVTAYPEVYLNNPRIYRVFKFGLTPYFMDDYVKDDTLIMQIDPYHHDSFIHKKKHLIDAWCDTYNIKSVTHQPEIYLTQVEIDSLTQKYARNKPLFVIQTNGGGENQGPNYSWARDIPITQAQTVVDIMNQTHHVMHIRRPNQLALNNAEPVSAPLRELFALIAISDKRLFSESFGYHCAAAFKLPSTVCFVGTLPKVYSYDFNTNITPQDEKTFIHTIDKYMEDSPWGGEKLYECPYDLTKLFSITQIVESLKKQPKNQISPVLAIPQTNFGQNQPQQMQQTPQQMQQQQNQQQNPQLNNPSVGNFIDNYFNAIYVINLDKRIQRWEAIQKQLHDAGIHNFKRMPGINIPEKELTKIPKKDYANFRGLETITNKEKFGKKYILGALGCRKAHLNCVKDAKSKNYNKILILEDDVMVDKNANTLFANIINEVGGNWGMLYLGGDYWDDNKTFQASSYALDGALFDSILQTMEKSGEETDFYYVNYIQPYHVTFRATPMIMMQAKNGSDIPTTDGLPHKIEAIQKIKKKGITFNCRNGSADNAIAEIVIDSDEYGLAKTTLEPAPTIIDIGANIGAFSLYANSLFKDSKIYAYEPEANNFFILKKNITENNAKNIFPFQTAISSKKQKLKLFDIGKEDNDFTQGKNTGGYTLIPKNNATAVDINQTVECISLKDIFEENKLKEIDLLKLDCEGAEYDIFYPLPKEYFGKIKNIILESHNRNSSNKNANALKTFLEKQGFECNSLVPVSESLGIMTFRQTMVEKEVDCYERKRKSC